MVKRKISRVTIRKVGGGFDISRSGIAVEFARTKKEAKMKSIRLRKLLRK